MVETASCGVMCKLLKLTDRQTVGQMTNVIAVKIAGRRHGYTFKFAVEDC